MKRLFLLPAIALTAFGALAQQPAPAPAPAPAPPAAPAPKLGDRADKLVQQGLPSCADKATVSTTALQHKLPINLTGEVVRIDSQRQQCAGQWVAITSREGDFFMGIPWFLDDVKGTAEQKLKAFVWQNMQMNMDAVVGKERTHDGFFPVTLWQTTEAGKMPMFGEIDPDGTVMFIGKFHPLNEDFSASRLKTLQSYIDASPTEGAAKPAVTVIEFSDFECPSCQHASTYMNPIMDKYGSQVRYIRYDLPLVMMHPWALTAAVAGRAIYHQKPELFWDYKKQVYANQEQLNAFTIDQFARNYAQDHDLDLKKYDAEVTSKEISKQLLEGAGAALSNDVRATPTYIVNGIIVDPGNNGEHLESYVAGLLKK